MATMNICSMAVKTVVSFRMAMYRREQAADDATVSNNFVPVDKRIRGNGVHGYQGLTV